MFKHQMSLVAIALLAVACTEPPSGTEGGIIREPEEDPVPVTTILVTPVDPAPGTPVIFDSRDLGVGARTWAFGDGVTDSGVVAVHAYGTIGTYDVQLALDNGSGAPRHFTIRVLVDESAREPEQAAELRGRP